MDDKTINKVIMERGNYRCKNFTENRSVRLDYLVTIGGDGTILYASKELVDQNPPILAFQRGTLGFMCRFKLIEIDQVVRDAVKCIGNDFSSPDFPFQTSSTLRIQSTKRSLNDGSKI